MISHLCYVHLGINETLPRLLFIHLVETEVDKALRFLKRRKRDIALNIADIHGISLASCIMHMEIITNEVPNTNVD